MKKLINDIEKIYNVKIIYKRIKDNIAEYDHNKKMIIINKEYKNKTKTILLPIIFHELGHKFCFENNLYYNYHHEMDIRIFKLTALKAERFVDKYAKNEMKKMGIKIKYPMFYYQKNRTKRFKEYIKSIKSPS